MSVTAYSTQLSNAFKEDESPSLLQSIGMPKKKGNKNADLSGEKESEKEEKERQRMLLALSI